MRVTESMKYAEVLNNLTSLNARYAKAARQATTGLRVDAPSADPIAAGELVRNEGTLARISAHRSTLRAVRGDAELSESTLGQAADLMARANEIAVQAGNGTLSAQDRQNLATEVSGLKAELVKLGNTRGTRGYIFGGSLTETPPFDNNGAFSGNDLDHVVDIGTGSPTVVSASGARAFTVAGGRDAFADLDALASALSTNNEAGVRASLTGLEDSRKQLTNMRADSGLVLRRLETSDAAFEQLDLNMNQRQNQIGAADPVEALSSFMQLGQSLERSVSVARQILQMSQLARFG